MEVSLRWLHVSASTALGAWDTSACARAGTEFDIARFSEIATDATGSAQLLKFDSVHGTWEHNASADNDKILIDGKPLDYSSNTANWRHELVRL
jgi:glyceraldehyde 3-phosphate dehydrogenase